MKTNDSHRHPGARRRCFTCLMAQGRRRSPPRQARPAPNSLAPKSKDEQTAVQAMFQAQRQGPGRSRSRPPTTC